MRKYVASLNIYFKTAIFVCCCMFSQLCGARSIECPAQQTNIGQVDFTSENCRVIDLGSYTMSSSAVWLRIPVDSWFEPINDNTPIGLFISGNLSLSAYIDGQYLGSKGRPSLYKEFENPGPFDWAAYIDKSKLLAPTSYLTIFVSSHSNIIAKDGFFNRIFIGEYINPTHGQLEHYWPSLVPLGFMLVGFVYLLHRVFSASNQHTHHRKVLLMFIAIIAIAVLQLCLEISRGIFAYPYYFHFPRIYAIAFLSSLFGHGLLLCYLLSAKRGLQYLGCTISIGATLIAQSFVDDYDFMAIVGIQIPALVGLSIILIHVGIRKAKFNLQNRLYSLAFGCLIAISLFTQSDFLDAYFYFFIATLLILLTRYESDRILTIENSLVELHHEARQLELALSLRIEASQQTTITIKSAGELYIVSSQDILYCKGAGDYVELHCFKQTLLYSGSLRQIRDELPASFLKVHRSYLANAKYIQKLQRMSSGNGELQMTNESKVPVSRAMYAEIKRLVAG